ncbi:MAG TPA: hypothetical protein VF752_14560 [Thermoleophilaceae bacterium]
MEATAPETKKRSPWAIVGASIVVLFSLAVLAAGVAVIWANATQRDSDGYFATKFHRYATPTRAIESQTLDVDAGVPKWIFDRHFAKVRITARSADPSKPVFIGIAKRDALDSYLRSTTHSTIKNLEFNPFSVSFNNVAGRARPEPPASNSIWAAKASGTGTQTVTWKVTGGKWAAAVMNADASPRVAVDGKLGAKVDLFNWLGIVLTAVGGVMTIGAGVLLYLAIRE